LVFTVKPSVTLNTL